MSKLIAIFFNDLWRAQEVQLTQAKLGNEPLAHALVVQRKFDNSLTHSSIDELSEKGLVKPTFWKRLRSMIFHSPPFGAEEPYSSAIIETISTFGVEHSFVEQIAEQLRPGTSSLMILVEEHQAATIFELAKTSGGTAIETEVTGDDLQKLSRTVEGKVIKIVESQKK